MTRSEQKEELKSLCIWTEESIVNYHASFLAHYHILNTLIYMAINVMNEDLARVAYFRFTEYLYSIYSEFCLTIECMLKALLERNGYTISEIRKKGHSLNDLYSELLLINDDDTKQMCGMLGLHKDTLATYSTDNVFVNSRYMSISPEMLYGGIDSMWELLEIIDDIAHKFFDAGNLISILYPDTV